MEKITIEPVTRVEGHGKVTVYLNENKEVDRAYFHVVEVRGFEKFCEGRLFWEMPTITERACGICPVSHHLASAKTGDAILGVKIPPTAKKLRELMHFGQVLQSHSLHFFFLASPDFLLGMDADPAIRNVVGVIQKFPDLAKKGIRLRSFGQTIIEILGGKKVHPRFAIPGGVSNGLSEEGKRYILSNIDSIIEDAKAGVEVVKGIFEHDTGEISEFGKFPSMYMGLVNEDGSINLYDGKIRIRDNEGRIVDEFTKDDYLSKIAEWVEEWSYMKFPFYKDFGYPKGCYRVGPLGRFNVIDKMGTPLADKEFEELRQRGKNGVIEGTLYYHYARMIEVLYCAERIKELMYDPDIDGKELRAISTHYNPYGIGILEAPRGTLIHHYEVDKKGQIRKVNLIVATVNNNNAINQAVTQVAKRYIKGEKIEEGMLNRVEAAIRAYDPCLSCATHSVGKMPLKIELLSSHGEYIKIVYKNG